ncbi:MAG: BRCT domain-containing protein [Deltaproteobacteria bacterium]|nr:BRCT domain-containing protein [Deltaproteobacteria bacterium]
MHSDHLAYIGFTGRSRFDKAVNSLLGIVEGISVDGRVSDEEIAFLAAWLDEHQPLQDRHPFNEIIPVLAEALADGVLGEEERLDLLWLCERLRSTDYHDAATADMQRLHGILAGIASDGAITEAELRGLSEWLRDHEHLRRCWPYDEVDSLIAGALADGRIDGREHDPLLALFSEFAPAGAQITCSPQVQAGATTLGLCAVCPEVRFDGTLFCFTGASSKYTRAGFVDLVTSLGARATNSVTRSLDYLVIGSEGNPCWSYACYGRKVEKAVALRRQGHRLLIVHENDFHDAVSDRA